MAKISSYTKDTQLSDKDKVIGSNYINTINGIDQFQTNNFTLKEISDFVGANVTTASVNLKTNGGIVEETIDNVDRLAIDLGASNITGQLANSDLANSSITINGTAVSLGGSVTTPDTNTQLSTEQVQDIVGAMFSGNTETRIAATYQDSDGTIDLVVDDMTTDANNYVTGASFAGTTTKTITLTRQGLSDITASFTDNDTIYTLPLATSSDRGGVKIGYTENGKNYPVELDNEKMYVNVPWTDTDNDTVRPVTAGGNTLGASETLAFTAGSNVTITENAGAVTIASTDTNTQLTTEEVQDIVGNMLTGNTETRIGVTYEDSDGTIDFVVDDMNYTLPLAASGTRGGIQVGYTESGKNYPVELDSEKAYVNVPWTDTNTQLSKETVQDYVGEMLSSNTETRITVTYDDANNKINFVADDQSYTLPTASSSTLGGVKVGGNLTIDGDGVLNVGAIALTTVQTAANQTAHLALTAQEGDIVVRSDENKSYVHNGGTAGTMADYTELLTPTDAVLSVTTTDGNYINLTPNSAATGAITVTADLSAVDGTSDTTDRFLTKDNTWAVPAYTTDTNTQRSDEDIRDVTVAMLTAGSNITLTEDDASNTLTITSTDTNTQLTTEQVQDIVGGMVSGNTETNIAVTYNDTSGKLNFVANDLDTNTTYDLSVPSSTTKIRLAGSDSTNDDVEIAGGTNVTVTRTNANKLTIAATDTNTFRTIEVDGSAIGATETLDLVAGNNITLSESSGEVTIDATDTNTQLSTEQVQDIVGSMVAGNTEANIIVSYDDSAGKLNFSSTNTQLTTAQVRSKISGTGLISYNSSTGVISTTANNYSLPTATSSTLGGVKVGTGLTITSGVLDVDLTTGGRMTGDLEIDNSDPNLILNDSTANSTSTTYTPAILFRADDVNKAVIGKKGGSSNIFHVENYDGPLTISGMQDSKTISAEFAHEPSNTSGHYGLKLTDSSTQSHSLYIGPSAFNNQSSLFFNGTTNALNVSRISHNNSLGTLLFDVPDDGTSSLSVKFRQYNTGGYMQNMIDFEDDGDIRNINGSYGTIISDRRAKENIVDATPKLDDILSLQVKNFNLIGSNKKQIGLIAQDVESIFPSWVDTRDNRIYKTHDENGVPLAEQGELVSGFEDGKSLKVGMEFAVLVKTIQELNAKIVALEARVQTLENN